MQYYARQSFFVIDICRLKAKALNLEQMKASLKDDQLKSITYSCKACSYAANVMGKSYKQGHERVETRICLTCNELREVKMSDSKLLDNDEPFTSNKEKYKVKITQIANPICLNCNSCNHIKWSTNKPCPKCSCPMEISSQYNFLWVDAVGLVKVKII